MLITRRSLVAGAAAGGTLAAGLLPRKLRAAELQSADAKLKPVTPPVAPPAIHFVDADGKTHTLGEYHGRGVVVNLWATWCPPCVEEMPSLAALAKALAADHIAVLPLSSDHGGAKAVEAFYARRGITDLPVLLDPAGAAARALLAPGLPTTVVIDRAGKERARLEGGANWSSPAAVAAVRHWAGG